MTTHPPLAIEATGLVKSFGDTRAVDGVDLAVRTGSIYGVLGPNGAGKTTTIRMLATLIRPDAGSARVLGHNILTEADAVRTAAKDRAAELLDAFGIEAVAGRLVNSQALHPGALSRLTRSGSLCW